MRADVLVIGGGQAGLAMGYHLAQRGVDHVILDAGDRVGAAWRDRWDSLTLFTPARYSALPGMEFPSNPEGYPGKDAVADYLEAYASTFGLPVRLGARVCSLRGGPDGYVAETDSGTRYDARHVVIATGPFQWPSIPSVPGAFAPEVLQLHSSAYRAPTQIPAGGVVVVGAVTPACRSRPSWPGHTGSTSRSGQGCPAYPSACSAGASSGGWNALGSWTFPFSPVSGTG